MNNNKKILIPLVVVLAALALFFFAISMSCQMNVNRLSASLEESERQREELLALQKEENPDYDVSKLNEIQTLLDEYFIGDIDKDTMTENLAAGMIAGLNDRWSYYISAEDYDSYLETVNNAYVGIGVTIQVVEGNTEGLVVQEVTPDSPAFMAGILPGDIITHVEGESTAELGITETKNRVRGEEGTQVTITVVSEGVAKDLTLTRSSIKTVNVTYELLQGEVGYIKIRNFESNSADDAISAIEQMQQQGAKSLLFDVRFNPGGYKNELVKLLDYLLPEGVLFRSENYDGTTQEDYSDASCLELPMVVLMNEDSYSAAEFFAAALSEYGVAKTVGTKTCGKGYFQTNFRLLDGSAINISIGKYTTPKGASLANVGLTPDVLVEITNEEYANIYYGLTEYENDKQLQEALGLLNP